MLLRRVIEHVKTQNWTAVALDFFIVIVGVFIGTNVTNWNDGRITQERSQTFTARLQNDLRVEFEYAVSLQAYLNSANEASTAAFNGLTQVADLSDRAILINIFRASQYQWYERRSATFQELLSSGELGLISDDTLRETAVRFYSNSATVFELIKKQAESAQLRQMVDELIDPDVRVALQTECGDREYESAGGVTGLFTISYPCEIAMIDDAAVEKAVASFRDDPKLVRALRRQAALFSAQTFNIAYMRDLSGMDALFMDEVE